MDASYSPSDPNSLASYLHGKAEIEKSELARALHDVLGGLIVAALMDLVWIEEHFDDGAAAHAKLQLVRESLRAAIDLKRRLIEELRPTLLDNFGLLAALRWHVDHFCTSSQVRCRVTLSETEPALNPEAAIAVFRVVQEALEFIASHGRPSSIGFDVEVGGSRLLIRMAHDGAAIVNEDSALPEYASVSHRIARLGGALDVSRQVEGGSAWRVAIPLDAHG